MSASFHVPRRWYGLDGPTALLEASMGVLETPPCPPDPHGPLLFAAIRAADVPAFLLVAKSFARAIERGRFAVLEDGSLTGEDRALLAHHCGDPQILMGRADNAPFPSILEWQGIAALLGRHETCYRIYLDMGRVALDAPSEVRDAIGRNRGFRGPGSEGTLGIPAMGANLNDAAILLPRIPADIHKQPEGARAIAAMLVEQGTGAKVLDAPLGTELTEDSAREAIAVLLA